MLNIAICDNEDVYAFSILKTLEEEAKFFNIKINFEVYKAAEDLLKATKLEPLKYSIMFLDILMGEMNGIELSRKVKEINKNIDIIFITSTKEYVFDAYDIGAINYILKPIQRSRLKEQFSRAISMTLKNKKNFVINKNSEVYNLNIDDIIYFEVRNRIVTVEYLGGKIEFYSKLSEIEGKVIKYNFIKCHRAYIVNPKYIFKIISNSIVLKDKRILPISKLKSTNIKQKFLEYIEN